MNVPLLNKVKKVILSEPGKLDMDHWIDTWPGYSRAALREVGVPPCGTTACIAGWVLILSSRKKGKGYLETAKDCTDSNCNVRAEAQELLQITERQARQLFFAAEWPEKYREQFYGAQSRRARAEVAVARINSFISSKGAV